MDFREGVFVLSTHCVVGLCGNEIRIIFGGFTECLYTSCNRVRNSAGFGIAPVTATLVEIRRPGVVFRPLPPGLPPVQTVLVWRHADASLPVIKNFLECFDSVKA